VNLSEIVKKYIELVRVVGHDEALKIIAIERGVTTEEVRSQLDRELSASVLESFYSSVVRRLDEDRPPEEKIPVTSIIYSCYRRMYYTYLLGDRMELDSILRVWVGKSCHETPVLREHEVELELGDIVGKVDGYEVAVILEEKTTRKKIPAVPYDHHVRQVEYYRVLLERHGKPVGIGAVLYVDVNKARARAFPVFFDRSLEEVEKEMLEKAEKLKGYLQRKELPPRDMVSEIWLCNYCRYSMECFRDYNPLEEVG